MTRMVQIRNMPEPMHRKIKARAAEAGMTLSDYLIQELKEVAEHPTREEIMKRLAERERFQPKTSPSVALREERKRR